MWALMSTYGMRWKVEGLCSSIKQIFGETWRLLRSGEADR